MKDMMDLSSGATVERRRQLDNESRDALLGNAINFPGMFVGGVTDLGEEFGGRSRMRSRRSPSWAIWTRALVTTREIASTLETQGRRYSGTAFWAMNWSSLEAVGPM
jgi:hypothetical protein